MSSTADDGGASGAGGTPPRVVARLGDLVVPRDSWAGGSGSGHGWASPTSSSPGTRLVDARGPHGLSPLDLAVLSGSAPSVATLLAAGADLAALMPRRGADPLLPI